MGFRNAYLFVYNVVQALGWSYALYLIIRSFFNAGTFTEAYADSGKVVGIFQGLSFLETIHGVLGLVKGSPVASLMQWGGRSNVLYGVIAQIPEVHKGFPVAAMLLAWASSEVIRYPWYASSLASCTPQWLTWLRYTAFIPLYPIGLIGEMGVVYQALPYLSARHIGTLTLPNSFNLSFEYCWFLRALMLLYPFLWWQLYSMLLKQRRMKVKRD